MDLIEDSDTEPIEDSVINTIMLEKLHECLPRLTDNEQKFITVLFYKGISETRFAE